MTAVELLNKHLALFASTGDVSEAPAIYHDDVTMEFPYAPEGHTRKLEGRDAILAFFSRIPGFAKDFRIGQPTVHEIAGGLVAEYHGSSIFIDTNAQYEQDYVLFMTVKDGRIAAMKEYYDGQRVLKALGEL